MDITLNPGTYQISSLRTSRFATAAETKTKVSPTSDSDQLIISREGRDSLEALADKTATQLTAMTKEDFLNQVRQWESDNQTRLEIDPYREVDPDGSIARKTYFESYLGQLMDMEDTIKGDYAGAYEEAVSGPIDSLAFISGKYLCTWLDYFDSGMPAKERQWTHSQLWAMLTDTHVALNDPYALAASGGPKTVEKMDEIARQAVKDKLDGLIKQ